jgi:acyl-CoA thioesterase I
LLEPLVYLALGDSAGRGIGSQRGTGYVDLVFERLARTRPDAHLVNACVSGATSADLVHYQLPRASAAQPKLATVFIGGNDLWRGVRASVFGEHVETAVRTLRAQGAHVLVGNVPDLSHAPAVGFAEEVLGLRRAELSARVRAFNDQVERIARDHGAVLVDLYGVGLADRAEWFSHDGFHPSDEGYLAWADALWAAMRPVVSSIPSEVELPPETARAAS